MEMELIEMSKDFKNRIKEKNIEIAKLKHFIIMVYVFISITNQTEDIYLINPVCNMLKQKINEFMNIDNEDI
tara:strand:+ start:406 stop:621 length:216 start_codon:yes stop_codon:yes gene_type:complete